MSHPSNPFNVDPRLLTHRRFHWDAGLKVLPQRRKTWQRLGNVLTFSLISASVLSLYAQASLNDELLAPDTLETPPIQAPQELPLTPFQSPVVDEDEALLKDILTKQVKPKPVSVKHGIKHLFAPLHRISISSPYGWRKGRMHTGVDLAAQYGSKIFAAESGKVLESGFDAGYGNYLLIQHSNGLRTRYAHCSQLLVKAGHSVKKGAVVAKVGNTGHSTGPHLHFEVLANGVAKNPQNYL